MRWGRTDQQAEIKPLVGSATPETVGRKIDYIVIEGKASGKSVRQQLAAEGINTVEYTPGKADKLTRLHVMSPVVKDGFVWVVESDRYPGKKRFRSWAEPLVQQICGYSGPGSILHDDMLDTTTQALRFINDMWLKHLPPQDVKEAARKRVQIEVERTRATINPYTDV
jgi:predicted phage terminase large subunit-like protein